MNILTSLVFAYAANAFWQLPLLVLAAEATRRLLRGFEASILYRVWLSCFVLALVIPALPLARTTHSAGRAPQLGTTVTTKSTNNPEKDGENQSHLLPRLGAPTERTGATAFTPFPTTYDLLSHLPVQVSDVFCFAYLGFVLFALTRLACGLWRTHTLVENAEPAILSPEWKQSWEGCLIAFGLKRTELLFSTKISSPATISWPRHIVIFPIELCDVADSEVAAAFCHELAHVRRKDFVVNLVCESLGILLYFHPALHWIRRRIQETRELASDDLAASAMCDRRLYAQNLLRLAQRMRFVVEMRAQTCTVGIFEGEILEERLMNLFEKKSQKSRLRTWLSIAASLTVLAGSCVVAAGWGLCPAFAESATQTDHPPSGWFLAGNKPQDYRSGVDKGEIREGQPSAYLESTAPKIEGFGTLMQSISAGNYTGKRIRLRAWVKSHEVSDWAGLWMRVDQGHTSVAFDNMQNRAIKGTQPWRMYDVVLDVPQDATGISFGVLLAGTGEVWMNHVSFEEVDKTTAATSSAPPVPATPVNLNFSK